MFRVFVVAALIFGSSSTAYPQGRFVPSPNFGPFGTGVPTFGDSYAGSLVSWPQGQVPPAALPPVGLIYRPLTVNRLFVAYDQDGWHANWPVPEQDHAYTGGVHGMLSLQGSQVDGLARRVLWYLPNAEYASGVGGKFRAFTPDNVTDVANPGPDERPYAGWLTSSFALQQRNRWVEDHVGLDVGLVGESSGAGSLQRSIHPARGWHTQLRDELTVNVRLRRAWKLRYQFPGYRFPVEAIPELSTDLGTVYRRVGGGVTLRTGMLPDDFLTPRIDDPGSLMGGRMFPGACYVFARGGVQYVGHNIFLDGNNWKNSRSVNREPIVGEFEAGFVWQFSPYTAFQWSWTRITDEFKTDRVDDSWGSLVLRFQY